MRIHKLIQHYNLNLQSHWADTEFKNTICKAKFAGIVVAISPCLLALLLFYSLAVHMHQSLGGWPEKIGTSGFPPALLMHDQIQGAYISYSLVFTFFVVPAILLVCLFVPRWRNFLIYCLLHLVLLPACYGLLQLAPEGYLYWWWDWRCYEATKAKPIRLKNWKLK